MTANITNLPRIKPNSELTVIITCAASQVIPSTVDALRLNSSRSLEFVGIDAVPESLSSCYLDQFRQVPLASDLNYFNQVLSVIIDFKADILLVMSDAEALVLARPDIRKILDDEGCTLLLPQYDAVKNCVDKGLLFDFLSKDLKLAQKYQFVDDSFDFLSCRLQFGYPEKSFVLKPRIGCGSRGVMIVDSDASQFDRLFERNYCRYTLENLQSILSGHKNLGLLAMPYYEGTDYNIDVLCQDGNIIYCLIQERISPKIGAILSARIVDDDDINKLLAFVVRGFNLTGLVNIEMARCLFTGVPYIYEINPRPSAAFAFLCYQGVDVLGDLINIFANKPIKSCKFRPMLVKRVWRQIYDDFT